MLYGDGGRRACCAVAGAGRGMRLTALVMRHMSHALFVLGPKLLRLWLDTCCISLESERASAESFRYGLPLILNPLPTHYSERSSFSSGPYGLR